MGAQEVSLRFAAKCPNSKDQCDGIVMIEAKSTPTDRGIKIVAGVSTDDRCPKCGSFFATVSQSNYKIELLKIIP